MYDPIYSNCIVIVVDELIVVGVYGVVVAFWCCCVCFAVDDDYDYDVMLFTFKFTVVIE